MGNLIIPYWGSAAQIVLTPELLKSPDVMLLADDADSLDLTGGLTSWTSLVDPLDVFTNIGTTSAGDRFLHTNNKYAIRADPENVRLNENIGSWSGGTTVISVGQFNYSTQPNSNFDYLYQIIKNVNNGGASLSRWANAPDKDDMYSFDGNTVRMGPPITGNQTYVFTQRFNTSATRHELWFDGSSQTVADHTVDINSTGEINLFSDTSSNAMLGQIQIFLLYKSALSDADRTKVESILMQYYSI